LQIRTTSLQGGEDLARGVSAQRRTQLGGAVRREAATSLEDAIKELRTRCAALRSVGAAVSPGPGKPVSLVDIGKIGERNLAPLA
jgi:hypothetical protein